LQKTEFVTYSNPAVMPIIQLETKIAAPVERVFDLARSIDAHTSTTASTSERAVEGRTSGLMEAGETVTWEAKHFGIRQRLTVQMTALERPNYFVDEMLRGAFASMCHRHEFAADGEGTLVRDTFEFTAPLGPLGWLAEKIFLTAYMKKFLLKRNAELKAMAESDAWRSFLK
jgi:ligand-binding SRPBCC domain-containing protein